MKIGGLMIKPKDTTINGKSTYNGTILDNIKPSKHWKVRCPNKEEREKMFQDKTNFNRHQE